MKEDTETLAETYLLGIPMWTRKKNSFEQIRMFLRELGDPQEKARVIHVAGTNGKGSVCAYLTSMLLEGGCSVGTFVSPHLVDVRERILLQGSLIGEELFQETFHQVLRAVGRLEKEGCCHPTFFEYMFYMALAACEKEKAEWLVLEAGLGGTLDTTNVIGRPAASVITSISMDHMEYLGSTIGKIAGQKAGIIKAGCPVIYEDGCPEASGVISDRAFEVGAPAYPVSPRDALVEERSESGLAVRLTGRDGRHTLYQVPFAAPYQAENLLLAVRTLEVLEPYGVDEEARIRGAKQTRWPGRMEQVMPGVWLDGAHNIGGIRAFVEAAGGIIGMSGRPAVLLYAVAADKEYGRMIREICEGLRPSGVVVAHMDNARSLDMESLVRSTEAVSGCLVEGYPNVKEAFDRALALKGERGLLFAAGSLYLVGEIKETMRRNGDD